MASITLRVRPSPNDAWYQVFSLNGWKVRDNSNTTWINMIPENTKVRNSDNSGWFDVE